MLTSYRELHENHICKMLQNASVTLASSAHMRAQTGNGGCLRMHHGEARKDMH